MSAIAALKGYRTQFLYSLHRIVFGVTDAVSYTHLTLPTILLV